VSTSLPSPTPSPIPTPHIQAGPGEIAEAILLPGDPLRAELIAQTFFTDVHCFNRVRGMLGFTGTYKGQQVSVMGTGMGMPSISIYATELIRFYGVKTAIRVGSAGGLREEVKVRDLVIAMSTHTNSNLVSRYFDGIVYAPTADYSLLSAAARLAGERGLNAHVGPIFTSDAFYDDNPDTFTRLAAHGTLAVEMEGAALYTIAAREQVRALVIATISDHLVTHEALSSDERQTGFMSMAELALDTAVDTR
jgi:purine-nucleoside phosphorylase